MSDEYLASRVCTALMRLGTRMATGFDQHFSAYGISQAQFRTLLSIWELGSADGVMPSVLAEHLLIERATISVLTSRMVQQGWLARVPGDNRRSFRLILTDSGLQLLQSLIPRAVELADQTLSDISNEQLRQMYDNLMQVEARLRAAPRPEE